VYTFYAMSNAQERLRAQEETEYGLKLKRVVSQPQRWKYYTQNFVTLL